MTTTPSIYQNLTQSLRDQLIGHDIRPVFVGFSGGLDSTLLLKCACDVVGASNVVSIHVHHGLSANADQWQSFCEQQVAELGCKLIVEKGQVESTGQGVEAAARTYRYSVFSQHVTPKHWLLLAHHLDDQVETFFLRMMRGTGLHGLKSMSAIQPRDHYQLCRPWLKFSRLQLEQAANACGLRWIEDESNVDSQYDRNYLRNEVLPLFESRWPSYRERVNGIIQQVDSELQSNAHHGDNLEARLSHDGGLKWVQLDSWSEADKLSLLHRWLTELGVQVPSKVRLQHVLSDVVEAKPDADPKVRMGNGYVRRHGPALYWVPEQSAIDAPPPLQIGNKSYWPGVGYIEVKYSEKGQAGLKANLPNLHWRTRQGGEQIRPLGRSKRRDLKRLLQEYRVKPWQRDRLPLLYSGDTLVAVADLFISADHTAEEENLALEVIWQNS
ncbi:tRNA lysidine(34) synthetase TilS [Reinekea marina]|uniref:tRNA(Ile)-lysidine synthase n=1 Tax=Reinekea marina TaxID=1310421 RepID=A0ABV7WSG8_9GAMM|nr:tRNA lysidine(34) synthetase TilS [Reinekea marina]MDN3650339.1 tRNA lysidine(34) synthetase TilS [Reinekea marina]MDN3651158.1 tRNA lysidine(34) synthetase TilS [Reinekea marina]